MLAPTPSESAGGSAAHAHPNPSGNLHDHPSANARLGPRGAPSAAAPQAADDSKTGHAPTADSTAGSTADPTATPKRPRSRPRKDAQPAPGRARPVEGPMPPAGSRLQPEPMLAADPAPQSDPAAALWGAMVSQFANPAQGVPPASDEESAAARARVHRASETDVRHEKTRRREAILRALERCAAAPVEERRRWTPHAVAAMCSLTWASLERWVAKDEELARLLRAIAPRAALPGVSAIDLAEVREMLDQGASVAAIARRHGFTKKALIALANPPVPPREAEGLRDPDRPKASRPGAAAAPATPRRRKARKTPQFSAEGLLALREMKALDWGAAQQAALFGTLGILELRRGCRDVSVLRSLDGSADFDANELRRVDPMLLAEAARSAHAGATLEGFCASIGRSPEALLAGCARFATVRLALARTPIGRCPPVDALLRANRTLGAATFDPPPQPPAGD